MCARLPHSNEPVALCLEAQRGRPRTTSHTLSPPGPFRHGGPAICSRQMETTMIHIAWALRSVSAPFQRGLKPRGLGASSPLALT